MFVEHAKCLKKGIEPMTCLKMGIEPMNCFYSQMGIEPMKMFEMGMEPMNMFKNGNRTQKNVWNEKKVFIWTSTLVWAVMVILNFGAVAYALYDAVHYLFWHHTHIWNSLHRFIYEKCIVWQFIRDWRFANMFGREVYIRGPEKEKFENPV